MIPGVHLTKNLLPKLQTALKRLPARDVLVGVPRSSNNRGKGPIGNAALLYIHEHGAPEANIPARPTLRPGVRDARPKIVERFKAAGHAALAGDAQGVEKNLHAAGLETVNAVKTRFASNTPPPLRPATLAARRRKGRTSTNTLIETGNLQNHITYVVREAANK